MDMDMDVDDLLLPLSSLMAPAAPTAAEAVAALAAELSEGACERAGSVVFLWWGVCICVYFL